MVYALAVKRYVLRVSHMMQDACSLITHPCTTWVNHSLCPPPPWGRGLAQEAGTHSPWHRGWSTGTHCAQGRAL